MGGNPHTTAESYLHPHFLHGRAALCCTSLAQKGVGRKIPCYESLLPTPDQSVHSVNKSDGATFDFHVSGVPCWTEMNGRAVIVSTEMGAITDVPLRGPFFARNGEERLL